LHVSCIVVVVVLLLKTSGKPMIIFLSKSFLWSDCKWQYVYGGFLGASQPYIMGALLLCKLFVPFILVTYMTRPKHSCYDSLLTKTAEVVTYPYKSPFNISSIEEHCDPYTNSLQLRVSVHCSIGNCNLIFVCLQYHRIHDDI
jgi:hypothetical protein